MQPLPNTLVSPVPMFVYAVRRYPDIFVHILLQPSNNKMIPGGFIYKKIKCLRGSEVGNICLLSAYNVSYLKISLVLLFIV